MTNTAGPSKPKPAGGSAKTDPPPRPPSLPNSQEQQHQLSKRLLGDVADTDEGTTDEEGTGKKRKRTKRTMGKACVYCRRSHMTCLGGRPCERCVKRDIAHLCRDFTPPPGRRQSSEHPPAQINVPPAPPLDHRPSDTGSTSSLVTAPAGPSMPLYADPGFSSAWPLLPDGSAATTFPEVPGVADEGLSRQGSGTGWGMADESELGALSKYLGDLGVPSLPGSFLDVLSYFSRGGTGSNTAGVPMPGMTDVKEEPDVAIEAGPTALAPNGLMVEKASTPMERVGSGKGKGKETAPGPLANVSRIEKYFLAAADQPTGPRAARLAQVIKAKYDAGLLKPYDYVKGYERMFRWMDSGRAAPKADSVMESAPPSPQKGGARNGKVSLASNTPLPGRGITYESRRRILAAMNGFRPKFRQIAQTLTEVDLVFIEEAMERWMLQYDRAFASIHTPSCIWRRTGEIQKANQEFANLTGVPASMFRNGQLCVYELMDEDSAVRYWEGYAKIAFDASQRSLYTHCTLKIPSSLSRLPPRQPFATPTQGPKSAAPAPPLVVPDLSLPQPVITTSLAMTRNGSANGEISGETFREMKCCFSVTVRRDAYGVPVAIMGQWIPI